MNGALEHSSGCQAGQTAGLLVLQERASEEGDANGDQRHSCVFLEKDGQSVG